MEEQWKLFAEGYYEASSEGRVRRKLPGVNTWPGRILKPTENKRGYLVFRTYVPGRIAKENKKAVFVHQIIASLFIGARPPGMDIHHIDGVATNNHAGNLEYVSRQEHMKKDGRDCWPIPIRYKFSEDVVGKVRRMRKGGALYREISKETGVSKGHVGNILHGGYRAVGQGGS